MHVQWKSRSICFSSVQAALKCGMKGSIINNALLHMTDAKVKDRLKSVTQEALDLGVSYIFLLAFLSVCMLACLLACLFVCISICLSVSLYFCFIVCLCILCVRLHACVCVCVWGGYVCHS